MKIFRTRPKNIQWKIVTMIGVMLNRTTMRTYIKRRKDSWFTPLWYEQLGWRHKHLKTISNLLDSSRVGFQNIIKITTLEYYLVTFYFTKSHHFLIHSVVVFRVRVSLVKYSRKKSVVVRKLFWSSIPLQKVIFEINYLKISSYSLDREWPY